jgi:hypothetical protein
METRKFLILPLAIQPVASRYTDCAIRVPKRIEMKDKGNPASACANYPSINTYPVTVLTALTLRSKLA